MALTHLFRRLFGLEATSRTPVRRSAGFRPRLEALEDRLTPANTISIIPGGTTLLSNPGLSSFSDTGTYSIDPSQFTGVTGTVTLRANGDISISNALPTLSGLNLTFQACAASTSVVLSRKPPPAPQPYSSPPTIPAPIRASAPPEMRHSRWRTQY